jgi:hypothetical protein|nr:hypothetical protein [Clostridium sp. AF37-5AT]DAZ50918.1 MAG TPA: hypothetical protein [Caudoviricetes sp.]
MIGLICGLVLAFILTMFGVDKIFINELQPLFANVTLTTGHFYIVMAVVGFIAGIDPTG